MQSLRLGFINAFQNMVFGKGADILFSKPVISLKSEVKIVNVTEEAKRECECGAGQPGEGANR